MPGGIRLRLHIQPRAARTELAGLHGGALKVRLSAPPVDGAANDALIRFIALRLGVPRSAVTVERGVTSREKTVKVTGVAVDAARAALEI